MSTSISILLFSELQPADPFLKINEKKFNDMRYLFSRVFLGVRFHDYYIRKDGLFRNTARGGSEWEVQPAKASVGVSASQRVVMIVAGALSSLSAQHVVRIGKSVIIHLYY